jgi:BlaI family penicillinase repressor
MTPNRPELTPAEWAIMRVMWSRREAIVRDVFEALESSRGWAQTSVRTMMERLARKGWLKQKKVGPVYLYRPAVGRRRALRETIGELADRLLGGDVAELVAYAVEDEILSDRELAALERLIRERKEKRDDRKRD